MTGSKIPIHGRNHRIGGSDPIQFPSGDLSWATLWGDADVDAGGGSFVQIRTNGFGTGFEPGFATNDSDTFEQDSYDGDSHWNGLLIQKPGVYITFAGATVYQTQNPPEPATSLLYAGWDSFYYEGSEFSFDALDHSVRNGMTNTPVGTKWSPYNTDFLYMEPDSTFPHQYTVSVKNFGTQTLGFHGRIFTLRISDSLASSVFPYYDGL